MILVVGATGSLGGLITRALLDRGRPVRILVRDASRADDLVAAGAQPVSGDLADADALRAACAGIDTVVTTATGTGRGGKDTVESVDRHGNRRLVEAAVAAGVRRYLFTSALGAHPDSPMPLLQAKGETEQRLRDSPMAWTSLQPNAFMDLLIPLVVGGPALAGEPVTLVGSGRRRHSFVATRDVAAYAVSALDRADAVGRTIPLGGPEPVCWLDVVAAFEHELGRPVPVRTVAPGTPIPGLPDFVAGLLAALDGYDSPLDVGALASAYGVTPTSLSDFVRLFMANRHPVG